MQSKDSADVNGTSSQATPSEACWRTLSRDTTAMCNLRRRCALELWRVCDAFPTPNPQARATRSSWLRSGCPIRTAPADSAIRSFLRRSTICSERRATTSCLDKNPFDLDTRSLDEEEPRSEKCKNVRFPELSVGNDDRQLVHGIDGPNIVARIQLAMILTIDPLTKSRLHRSVSMPSSSRLLSSNMRDLLPSTAQNRPGGRSPSVQSFSFPVANVVLLWKLRRARTRRRATADRASTARTYRGRPVHTHRPDFALRPERCNNALREHGEKAWCQTSGCR